MTHDLAVKYIEANNREISTFSALVIASSSSCLFNESTNLLRFKGELVWAVIPLGLSKVSILWNSKVPTLKYTACIGLCRQYNLCLT